MSGRKQKNLFADKERLAKQDAVRVVNEARDTTAKKMGFSDFDHALKSRLKDRGFEVNEPVDEKTWKLFKGEIESDGSYDSEQAKKIYASVDSCYKDIKSLEEISYYSVTDLNELKKIQEQIDKTLNKYRDRNVKVYSNNIPDFVSEYIGENCKEMKNNPEQYNAELNPEAAKACENFEQLKREAVSIFRLEGTPEYFDKAEKFVRENYFPRLVSLMIEPSKSANVIVTDERTDVEKARDRIQNVLRTKSLVCYDHSVAIRKAAQKVAEDFMVEVNTTKTTVDSVINAFYSNENKANVDRLFQETKADVQQLVFQFIQDSKKRDEISKGYESLSYFWMKSPEESSYKKNSRGLLVLTSDNEDNLFGSAFDNVVKLFSDPRLSYFSTTNANYAPEIKVGQYSQSERVSMLPRLIRDINESPHSFQMVLAHEVGHKIGPLVSKINGYDLRSEYRDLLACYKDRKSIKLEVGQEDEAIADYIAAEVMARQISKMPQEQRQSRLVSSMETFCRFDARNLHTHSVECKGSHPEVSLRISVIFGANPNLRKAIGCECESPSFKSCGLSQIKLPEDSQSGAVSNGVTTNSPRGIR